MRSACVFATLLLLELSACAIPGGQESPEATRAPRSNPGNGRTSVLLLSGASIWSAEEGAIETILYRHGVTYRSMDAEELNAMSLDDLISYGLMIVPGGDAIALTRSLRPGIRGAIRDAVRNHGVSYLGFCAGAWAAVAPAPEPGADIPYGFAIVEGPIQQETALARSGSHYIINSSKFPDGSRKNLLWYGGPITPEAPGAVIARYSDGTPAISQLDAGQGFVILAGLHPAVTVPILQDLGLGNQLDAVAPDFAWTLMDSALNRKRLPAF